MDERENVKDSPERFGGATISQVENGWIVDMRSAGRQVTTETYVFETATSLCVFLARRMS